MEKLHKINKNFEIWAANLISAFLKRECEGLPLQFRIKRIKFISINKLMLLTVTQN